MSTHARRRSQLPAARQVDDSDRAKTAAGLQQTCPSWLVMWSPWRQKFSGFASFTSEPVIVDEAEEAAFLQRVKAVELASASGRDVRGLSRLQTPARPGPTLSPVRAGFPGSSPRIAWGGGMRPGKGYRRFPPRPPGPAAEGGRAQLEMTARVVHIPLAWSSGRRGASWVLSAPRWPSRTPRGLGLLSAEAPGVVGPPSTHSTRERRMGKKRGEAPKIVKTAKVTSGRRKGHVHRYTAYPNPQGGKTYRCGGCGHAYDEN